MNTDTFMCSSDEKQTRSPLSLYSEYQRMEIEFRAPHIMPTSHWHGQVEVNVPFDGDVEYLINNEKVNINQSISTVKNKRKLSTPCLEAVGPQAVADLKAVDLEAGIHNNKQRQDFFLTFFVAFL